MSRMDIGRAIAGATRRCREIYFRARDKYRPTYAIGYRTVGIHPIIRTLPDYVTSIPDDVVENYLAHRFNLLGSGWVHVRHGRSYWGLEANGEIIRHSRQHEAEGDNIPTYWVSAANRGESERIWSLVDAAYDPIDWHVDFKSGYRWSEGIWYKDIRNYRTRGADPKVPWELARFQHLPQLALAYKNSRREDIVREYRNQIIDFVANNPPRYGINWASTMEVGIRAANWILAYSIFHSEGVDYDKEFRAILERSLFEHGRHIIMNLEWYGRRRGNHYLANIAGLAFIGSALRRNRSCRKWLGFAIGQLGREVQYQFTPDGCHFEKSTAYHRYASDIVLFATALIHGLPARLRCRVIDAPPGIPELIGLWPAEVVKHTYGNASCPNSGSSRRVASPFPPEYYDRLRRMAEFVCDITKPDGSFPLIGDNDSGRFFKLAPPFKLMSVEDARRRYRNLLSYREWPGDFPFQHEEQDSAIHVAQMAAAICHIPGLRQRLEALCAGGETNGGNGHVESIVGRWLAGSWLIDIENVGSSIGGPDSMRGTARLSYNDVVNWAKERRKCGCKIVEKVVPALHAVDEKDVVGRKYSGIGLYVFRGENIFVAFRAPIDEMTPMDGHRHNDALHIEIAVGHENIVRDPGSYLYGAVEGIHQQYRSVAAHASGMYCVLSDLGFASGHVGDGSNMTVRAEYSNGVLCEWRYREYIVERLLYVSNEKIVVVDALSWDHRCKGDHFQSCAVPFSPGYGIVEIGDETRLGHGVRN